MRWLLHLIGVDDPSGGWYLFWSGFGPDIPLVAGVGLLYRKHVCHERRCPRIGLHHIDGTPLVVCRRHHPAL